MAHFLRDQQISNITVTEDLLTQVGAIFQGRWQQLNSGIDREQAPEKEMFISYIIRFDNKGYRVFTLDDLLMYFRQGNKIERILFTIESAESLHSSRSIGTVMELRLDKTDPNTCFLMVTANDGDWVDASFSAIHDVLVKFKNHNSFARSEWTRLGVQIVGVTLGFLLSLWAAIKISPSIKIENSFIISFLFVLLIFSNTWTYLNQKIIYLIGNLFPNLRFFRPSKDKTHWLLQTIVGGIALAITLYILGLLFSYFGEILGGLVD